MGFDNLADFGETVMGATGAYSNTTYFNSDQIHPKVAGTTLVAQVYWNSAAELLGSTESAYNTYTTATTMAPGDRFAALGRGATAATTFTQHSCVGYSLPEYRSNRNATYNLSITPASEETIKGAPAASKFLL